MNNCPEYKIELESNKLTIEFEVVSLDSPGTRYCRIKDNQKDIKREIEKNIKELERLTSQNDKYDNIFSVLSGSLCGIISSLLVGEFSLKKANTWGTDKVEKFVRFVAKKQSGEKKDLIESIKFLESWWPSPSDSSQTIYGGKNHHLNDYSHHPSFVGLFFSLLTQFTGKTYGVDSSGKLKIGSADSALIGNDIFEKVSLGLIAWFFHLVSDVAGSVTTAGRGKGTGLPGPIVALLEEASTIPFFRNKDEINKYFLWVSRLWNGALKDATGTRMPVRFDLRTEIGVYKQLGEQSIPVIINDCLVRGFYFIRRFVSAAKGKKNLSDIKKFDWKRILPFNNRTIMNMQLIAAGTFVIVDSIGSGMKAMKNSGGNSTVFLTKFFLRFNFVGFSRFLLAVRAIIGMNIKLNKINRMLKKYNTNVYNQKKLLSGNVVCSSSVK